MTFKRTRLAALVLLCTLFTALTMNRGVYNLLYLITASMTACVVLAPKPLCSPRASLLLLMPAAFFMFVAISPGCWFVDMPLATIMACSFVCGMGICISDAANVTPLGSVFVCQVKGCQAPPLLSSILAMPLLLVPSFCALLSLNMALLWTFCAEAPYMLWDTRITLLFDHPNVLGYITSMALLGCAVYFRYIPRLWLLPCLMLMGGGLFIVALAGSRGVYAGLALATLPVLVLIYRRQLLYIVLGGLAIASLIYITLPAKHQDRLISAIMNPMSDITIISRLPIWDAAMDGFRQSPATGNGLRNFEDHHEIYVNTNRATLEERGPIFETRIANPHNLYLGLLYGYGWIGTGLLALSMALGLLLALKERSPESALYLACMVFVLCAGLVDYSLHRKDGILMLFLPMGMVYAQQCLKSGHKLKKGLRSQRAETTFQTQHSQVDAIAKTKQKG